MTALSEARRDRGAEGVRALLLATFARCDTATAACIALGMSIPGDPPPVSRLLRTARRVGAEWPYAATKPTGISEVTHLVDTLGVRGAARELGVSPSAVSRRMARCTCEREPGQGHALVCALVLGA